MTINGVEYDVEFKNNLYYNDKDHEPIKPGRTQQVGLDRSMELQQRPQTHYEDFIQKRKKDLLTVMNLIADSGGKAIKFISSPQIKHYLHTYDIAFEEKNPENRRYHIVKIKVKQFKALQHMLQNEEITTLNEYLLHNGKTICELLTGKNKKFSYLLDGPITVDERKK